MALEAMFHFSELSVYCAILFNIGRFPLWVEILFCLFSPLVQGIAILTQGSCELRASSY